MLPFENPEDPAVALKIFLISYLHKVVSSKNTADIKKMLEAQHALLEDFRGICNVLCDDVWGAALKDIRANDNDKTIMAAAKQCLKFLVDDVQGYYDSFE